MIADSSYHVIATVKAGDGARADLHEFRLTSQGTALITAYQLVMADLSSVGGPKDDKVWDSIVQEIDVKTGKLLLDWHSLDHVPLSESVVSAKTNTGGGYHYFHVNSIAVANDGNLIVSARHTDAVYEISRHTGAIISQLGGKHSSFTMGAGIRFAYQHDAEQLPNWTITIFDDESSGAAKSASESRAISIEIDTTTMAATLKHADTHAPLLLTSSQGNVQTLPNGDELVGWGNLPNVSEFGPGGQLVFGASLPSAYHSYRAYRFDWTGTPSSPPAVAAVTANGSTTVYASWNGATQVTVWQLLAGARPGALAPIMTSARQGFETTVNLKPSEPCVAVRALNATGSPLGTSATIKPART
jgi:hypothetical protein